MSIVRDADGYFNIYDLARGLGGHLIHFGCFSLSGIRVDRIKIDSRKVSCGDAFATFRGKNTDGETYAPEAFARGAVAVICSRGGALRIGVRGIYIEVDDVAAAIKRLAVEVRRDGGAHVVGITGSVGKTTVRELCRCVLSQRFLTDSSEENFNNALGVSLSIVNAFSAETVERCGKSAENDGKYLVLEMGISLPGEMDELVKIAYPEIAVITNIGVMHSETLGGRNCVAREKSRIGRDARAVVCPWDPILFENGFLDSEKCTVLCLGDEVEWCGFGGVGHVSFSDADGEELYGDFDISFDSPSGENVEYMGFTAPIVGRHGVFDSAIAVAVGRLCGVSESEIRAGLREYSPIGMRQILERDGGILRIVDCYNSGPDSVRAALSAMVKYSDYYGCKRRVTVLGSMLELGEISRTEHYSLGRELVGYGIDLLFCIGSEAREIARGAFDGGMDAELIFCFDGDSEREKIKNFIASKTGEGDIILYKASRGIRLEELT